jgi:hypothetical protein
MVKMATLLLAILFSASVIAADLTNECRIRVLYRAQIEQWEQMLREDVPRVYVDDGKWAALELEEDLKGRIRVMQERLERASE